MSLFTNTNQIPVGEYASDKIRFIRIGEEIYVADTDKDDHEDMAKRYAHSAIDDAGYLRINNNGDAIVFRKSFLLKIEQTSGPEREKTAKIVAAITGREVRLST